MSQRCVLRMNNAHKDTVVEYNAHKDTVVELLLAFSWR